MRLPTGRAYYAGRTILLTGATGLLGKALIEAIVRTLPDIARLYVLVRPKREEVVPPLPCSVLRVDEDETFEEARRLAPGWDVRMLLGEWREWVKAKGITVQNPDANFLSFCKARGPYGG